jgi:two-component system NtrC family response regulator
LARTVPGKLLFATANLAGADGILRLFGDLETRACPLAEARDGAAAFLPDVALVDLSDCPAPADPESILKPVVDLVAGIVPIGVVVLVPHDGRQLAARAIGRGAADFFLMPIDPQVLSLVVRRVLRIRELEEENDLLRRSEAPPSLEGILGGSDPIRALRRSLEKVAPTDATVLVLGESGTGKELAARALHRLGTRRDQPFVALNCAAIPENLLESELFGFERGAFTGAVRRVLGKLETAQGGTVFFDEIGEMPMSLQAKLLRVLQDRTIERIGGRETVQLDLRIVCATNRNLEAQIAAGAFREDLFYRIAEVTLRMPPLRERGADVLLIARALLARAAQQHRRPARQFSEAAIDAIRSHPWPGNIRELENRITGAVIVSDSTAITAADLGLCTPRDASSRLGLREVRRRAEKQAVEEALQAVGGNLTRAAELLGITRPTLYDLIERLGLPGREAGGADVAQRELRPARERDPGGSAATDR